MRTSGRWTDTKKGWRSGMKKRIPTLEQFAKIVRTNKRRLERLYEDLDYANYLMISVPGINYDAPRVQKSPPRTSKIVVDLDRIDRIQKQIDYYESMNVLWEKWQKVMTPQETNVFHKRFMQDKKVVDISSELMISESRIYTIIKQLDGKWKLFFETYADEG